MKQCLKGKTIFYEWKWYQCQYFDLINITSSLQTQTKVFSLVAFMRLKYRLLHSLNNDCLSGANGIEEEFIEVMLSWSVEESKCDPNCIGSFSAFVPEVENIPNAVTKEPTVIIVAKLVNRWHCNAWFFIILMVIVFWLLPSLI